MGMIIAPASGVKFEVRGICDMVLHKLYYSTVQRRDIRAKVQKQLVKGLQTAWVRDRALASVS